MNIVTNAATAIHTILLYYAIRAKFRTFLWAFRPGRSWDGWLLLSSCSAICSAHLIFYCRLLLNEMFVLNVWLQRFVKFSRICDFHAVGAIPASNAISFLNCTRIDCTPIKTIVVVGIVDGIVVVVVVVSPNQDHSKKSKGIYINISPVTLQLNNTHFSHSTDLQVYNSKWIVKFKASTIRNKNKKKTSQKCSS